MNLRQCGVKGVSVLDLQVSIFLSRGKTLVIRCLLIVESGISGFLALCPLVRLVNALLKILRSSLRVCGRPLGAMCLTFLRGRWVRRRLSMLRIKPFPLTPLKFVLTDRGPMWHEMN